MLLRRNILIFHQAALGDFIVTWPLAVALGRMFAQSRIRYVTHASKGELAARVIGVESINAEGEWSKLHEESPGLSENVEKILGGAQMIVSFVSNPGDIWEKNVAAAAPGATLIRLKTNPLDDAPIIDPELPPGLANHVTAALVSQLGDWPMIAAGVRQILRSVLDRGLPVRRMVRPVVVIHPGAGKPEKCWPVEYFVELIERFSRREIPVRVLLGEVEFEKWPADAIERISRSAEVRRPGTYVQLLDEIAEGTLFIGNDSGPAHLAAMIGVPTVSLFGTSPERWKPIGPHVSVIRGAGMESIGVDEVEAEALQWMKRMSPKSGTNAGAESTGLNPAGQ